ncbi:MAG: ABC transporter permease [Eubacteriales bacterium]|nr:ABC transporter permease [Eubacteriales bacterium]
MLKYTLSRFLQAVITILLVVTIVFLLMRLLPTDYYFTEDELMKLTDEQKHDQLEAAGLLDPPLEQLMRYYKDLLQGDFGTSRRIKSGKPVVDVIGSKFTVSMRLGIISLVISLLVGIPLGALQARFKGRFFDKFGTVYTVFVNAVPALVSYSLVLVFGAKVLGLPSMYSVRNVGRSSILPVVCLSMGSIAHYMLWTRRYTVDELNKDYIKLARLKGLTNNQIIFKHVLKNSLVPLAQYIPGSILWTLGGSLLVERFFSVPGMGTLLTDAINRYDTPVVQTVVMFYAALGTIGVFLGDVMMTMLDPRIRLGNKEKSR